MEIQRINELLKGKGIKATGFSHNTKASDYFVAIEFSFEDGHKWNAVVPYIYRRSSLHLKTEEEK